MKTRHLIASLIIVLFLALGFTPLAGAEEFPGEKAFTTVDVINPIGIGKQDIYDEEGNLVSAGQTTYEFNIKLIDPIAGVDITKDVVDVVPAEFDVMSVVPTCGAVETYEPRKKGSGFFFSLMRPTLNPDVIVWDLDCSDHPSDCIACDGATEQTLTVRIGTDLNPGHAYHPLKNRTAIYEPTQCGPLIINDGAVLVGSDEDEVVYEPSNSLVVATCLNEGSEDCVDADGDGWSVDCGDYDTCDENPDVNPGVLEICNDGIDNNCNGSTDCDDPDCAEDENCQVGLIIFQ
jgi:hypothetical protein